MKCVRTMLVSCLILLIAPAVSAEVAVPQVTVAAGPTLFSSTTGAATESSYQLVLEWDIPGPLDLGVSLRKEGPRAIEGNFIGLAARYRRRFSGKWDTTSRFHLEYGLPGIAYSQYHATTGEDGRLQWQEWRFIATGAWFPFVAEGHELRTATIWLPTIETGIGWHPTGGRFRLGVGVRGSCVKFVRQRTFFQDDGQAVSRESRHRTLLPSAYISIGF